MTPTLAVSTDVYSFLACPAETEDVVHEVFLRALAQSKKWLGLRNPVGYLYRAARNEALSRLRKQGVRDRAAAVRKQEVPSNRMNPQKRKRR